MKRIFMLAALACGLMGAAQADEVQVAVASKRVPYFKTGKDLRDRLNKEAARAAGLLPADDKAGDKK